ncbi:fimbrial protein SefA, partial [Salmonella enterica subsp. enterica serovar Enteritidis]|nr:fimbrial protein SefA [Salmonella enterica subsp. enterica serovar Enteritidis]
MLIVDFWRFCNMRKSASAVAVLALI